MTIKYNNHGLMTVIQFRDDNPNNIELFNQKLERYRTFDRKKLRQYNLNWFFKHLKHEN